MSSYHLQPPDAAAIQHSKRVIEYVVDEIKKNGGMICFRDYMNHLLYAPGLGYYSAGLNNFGETGDFATSPEISPLFGRTLSNQCEQLFEQGCKPCLFEFGAGSGKLCKQIMTGLTQLECYYILELSADLRVRQQEYLQQNLTPDIFERISWLDKLPTDFSGIILANELLDAMPVNLLQKNTHWCELGIGFNGASFHWCHYSTNSEAIKFIKEIEQKFGPYINGYTTEVNLNYSPWFKSLSQSVDQVAILLIDYGYQQAEYYHPQRVQGTLLCHYHHQAHADALILPGLQDITASIDFDAVAQAALTHGFKVAGLINQGQFLLDNGLLEIAELSTNDHMMEQLNVTRQIKTLTLPNEMGERFKVLGLTKNLHIEPTVFKSGRKRSWI